MNNHLTAAPLEQETTKPALREGAIIAFLAFTVTLVVMNTMMFNLALPNITIEFGLTSVSASWIVTGYSIVFAISSITYTRLSDFLPIRTLLIIGLSSMGGASVLGFFSHDYVLLLVARLLQASGAASVAGLGIVLLTRYIPVERRGKAMSIVMSASSLGLGLGPVLGGAITQYLGWNSLFLITSVSLLMIPVFARLIPQEQAAKGTFDTLGAALIGIGTTGLLLFLTNRMLPVLAVSVLALLAFWVRIHRTDKPFVQPALFRNGRFMTLNMLGIFSYMISFSTLFLLPQLLVHLYHLSPGQSGFIIFPGAILSMLASGMIGRTIDRLGNRVMFRIAPWMLLAAAALFALFASTSFYAIMAIYMLLSVAFSALTTSVSNEISRILPYNQVGAGMGLFQLTQFFSGALSVAVASSILTSEKALPVADAFANLFWLMTAVSVAGVLCSFLYKARKNAQAVQLSI